MLQNNKVLLNITVSDDMHDKITYYEDKKEIYVDAYKKWKNFCVKKSKS